MEKQFRNETCPDKQEKQPFLLFSERAALADAFMEWIEKVGAAKSVFNVITFLDYSGLINIKEAKAMAGPVIEKRRNNEQGTPV